MDHVTWEVPAITRTRGLTPAFSEIECALIVLLCVGFGQWFRGVIS